jgi:aminoglycoside 6'-N-acetyltransferase I
MRIVDLDPGDEQAIQQVAAPLVEAFQEHWPDAWPDMASALETVRASFGLERLSQVAVTDR